MFMIFIIIQPSAHSDHRRNWLFSAWRHTGSHESCHPEGGTGYKSFTTRFISRSKHAWHVCRFLFRISCKTWMVV